MRSSFINPETAARTTSPLRVVIIGLTVTSSWGNGHATTYRGLVRELVNRGHDVLFLEHDKPWYASNRDLLNPPFGKTKLYESIESLQSDHAAVVREADCVIVGSYVPQGVEVGGWVQRVAQGITAFYDIDTPVTLSKLKRGDYEYLAPELIPHYDIYLSFTGGPTLLRIERQYGVPRALPLYCSVDPLLYYPESSSECQWDLGYLGTYSDDRQPPLNQLMLEPARQLPSAQFVVAGPQYPKSIEWPANVQRIEHLPPAEHRSFYNRQRFALNITRADMVAAGFSPSVRLFEAAACGTPIISDWWEGLDTLFTPDEEVLISRGPQDTLRLLSSISESQRLAIGQSARAKVLAAHTASHRAQELEQFALEAIETKRRRATHRVRHRAVKEEVV